MVKLGDICIINPKVPELDDNLLVSFIPMQNITNDGQIDLSEHRKYCNVKKGFTGFQDNDILFAKITPCMENGKGALVTSLTNGIGFGSTEFHVLRPNPDVVYSKWLYYVTVWDVFRKECEKHMTGSAGQKRVPKTFIENFQISLPSIEQQRRVVTLLDKVNLLISLRKQQLDKLDELVKARFVEMFGLYFEAEWEQPLNAVCDFIDYRGKTPEKSDFGIPLITAKNVRENGFSAEPREFIPAENYDKIMTRGFPQVNDVLFTTEAPLGNVCRIPDIYERFCVGQRIITMHPHNGIVTSEFLEYSLLSRRFQDKLWEKSSGSTVKGIRSKLLEWLTIPVPPIKLQCKFSKFVAEAKKCKLTVQQGLDKLEMMKKALMQQYFG